MSTVEEQARALKESRQFLIEIAVGDERGILPQTRLRARQVLRHFPFDIAYEWFRLNGVVGEFDEEGFPVLPHASSQLALPLDLGPTKPAER